ncbi:MAG TPA: ring-cleaving dioxygenase [Devosiaceae bacterium]|jgi:glyoxalase family protein|nr:ring-cleaving dioxygenase [Devosiaceae bacterium]
MSLQLKGIHHLTAITADAPRNLEFYTQTLGLRLIKKTVNQDDTSAYHLFYGDAVASPGADLTFFDWPTARERRGTNAISGTALRVGSAADLEWWRSHLAGRDVAVGEIGERAGHLGLDFEDFEGQRLRLVADPGSAGSHPWDKSPVPAERQIHGLGPITLSVPDLRRTEPVLTQLMNMREVRSYEASAGHGAIHVFEMGDGGGAAELHVEVNPDLPPARQGAGGVHHVAFRTPDKAEFDEWVARTAGAGVPSSGEVERYYFTSLYFREPNGMLFEIATDGPGFTADEPLESLGERLALPPFLEGKRASIEAGLKPLG